MKLDEPKKAAVLNRSDAPSAETRFAPRRSGRVPALLYVETQDDGVPCYIKNMSATGARIELLDKWTHPFKSTRGHLDRVWLLVRTDRMIYDCKIVRRQENDFGLAFAAPPQPLAKGLR
jgi:PilZ domain